MLPDKSFTIGICCTDETENVSRIVSCIGREALPPGISISDLVVVISGCPPDTASSVIDTKASFSRTVIAEEKRRGKAHAINTIIDNMRGANLLLINGDALPEKGDVASLMEDLVTSDCTMMCARPLPASSDSGPLANSLLRFLWSLHNSTMETLERCGKRMHLTDEMIAIKGAHVLRLPEETVNDGAFVSTLAQKNGERVSFSRRAVVRVSVPRSVHDIAVQRRRILFGHLQVKELLGVLPATAGFTAANSPYAGLKIISNYGRKHPLESLIFPLAVVVEIASLLGALHDRKRKSEIHTVWRRVENAAWR